MQPFGRLKGVGKKKRLRQSWKEKAEGDQLSKKWLILKK